MSPTQSQRSSWRAYNPPSHQEPLLLAQAFAFAFPQRSNQTLRTARDLRRAGFHAAAQQGSVSDGTQRLVVDPAVWVKLCEMELDAAN
jgi:hypothetical protein